MQLLDGLLVVAKIFLAANEDNGEALAEMKDFGNPLWNQPRYQHLSIVTPLPYS